MYTPTENAFSTMFLFLNTPIWSLYLYTTFPIHIGSTHIMLRIRMQHFGQNKELFVFLSQNHQVTYFILRIRK